MASKYWIKLYHEILDDPKMGRLPDRLYRRTIELFLLAGDHNNEGHLPSMENICWRLRLDAVDLIEDVAELCRLGILEDQGEKIFVVNFQKRQEAISNAERMKKYRDRKRQELYYSDETVTNDVTKRNTDTDIEEDTDSIKTISQKIIDLWREKLPGKQKPRLTDNLKTKVLARIKEPDWMDTYLLALVKASSSNHLKTSSWFDIHFLLRNEGMVYKVSSGYFDSWDEKAPKQQNGKIISNKDSSFNA